MVTVHEGDIATFPWPADRDIEILFIDIAKNWATNDVILHQFLPRLIAGVSVVIQQDYHWPGTPWIPVSMELLAGHVTYLGSLPWATAFYRWERPLAPGDVPERPWDRVPALVSAALVCIPAAAVPAMGCYVIATGGHGIGWDVIAGFLALLGAMGLGAIIAGVVTAIRRVRSPIPLLLVAAGTTVALVAGLLMTPVMMAAVGLG